MDKLSKRDRDILTMISEGMPDLQVCAKLGILPEQLEKAMDRLTKLAEVHPSSGSMAVYLERALRRRAENAARSLEARFRALLEASLDAVLVVNAQTGTIDQANDQAAQMFGYPEQEIVGLSVEELVPDSYKAIHPAYRKGFLLNTRKREMGYHPPIFARKKDGSEIEIAVALTASSCDEEVMVVCKEFARWNFLCEEEDARKNLG